MKIMVIYIFVFMHMVLCGYSYAQTSNQIIVDGVIGDFAIASKAMEINGKLYKFPKSTTVEDHDGSRLSFSHIKGGVRARVYLITKASENGAEAHSYKIVIFPSN